MTSAFTVGGLEVYFRDETSRFTTAMMRAGTMVDQQSARMNRSLQNVSSSADRMNRSLDGINSNAFRALALSALRAEDNTKRLENSLIAVSALATGLSGAFIIRGLAEASDQYRNIQNRIATTTNDEAQRVVLNERTYQIARDSRSEYQATAILFARLSAATEQLGVSQADVLRVTEAIQKSFVVAGSTTQEAQSAAIQLAQGLASGRLQGDELKSILENNIPLARILARELAGGSLGTLRDMGSAGELTPDAVFNAIARNVGAIDDAFQQTLPAIQQGIVAINTALTRFVGEGDEALGISLALGQGLKAVADNFDVIASAALLAGTAIATSLIGGRLGAGAKGGLGIAATIKAEREAVLSEAQALRRAAANEIVQARTSLDTLGMRQGGADSVRPATSVFQFADADSVKAYERSVLATTAAQQRLNKLTEDGAQTQQRVSSIAVDTGAARQRAAEKVAAAEAKIQELMVRRAEMEAKVAGAAGDVDRSKLKGLYTAQFDLAGASEKYKEAVGREAAMVAEATRQQALYNNALKEMQAGAAGAADSVSHYGMAAANAASAAQMATQQRKAVGKELYDAEKKFASEAARVDNMVLSQKERYASQVVAVDRQIERERAVIQRASEAERKAVANAELAAEKQRTAALQKAQQTQAAIQQQAIAVDAARANQIRAQAAVVASAEANAGMATIRNTQQLAAAQAALAASTARVTTAKAALTRASIAMATAQRLAMSAATGLVGVLGGPAGIAITAATLGMIAYMNSTAQAAAREEKWAEALKRRADAMGAANAAAAVDVQISQQSRAVAEAQREAAQAQADLLRGAQNLGFAGLTTTAELRNQLVSLAREAGNGTLAFADFKSQIDKLRESGQISADLAARMIKLAENVEGAKANVENLKDALSGLEDKKVNLTLQVDVVGPDGALKLLGIQGPSLAPGGLDQAPPVLSDAPMLGLDDPYQRTPLPKEKPNIESFAPPPERKAGRSKEEREADRLKKQYDDLIKSSEDQIKSLEIEAKTYGMTEEAAARYRAEQEFLVDAERLGKEVFAANETEIRKMAAALGDAEVATLKAAKAQQVLREQQDFYAGLTKGFLSDVLGAVRNGEDVWQAFADAALSALDKIMDRLLSMAIDEIFKSMFQGGSFGAGGGSFFASFLKALGFARGGYVDGPGTATSDSIPARLSKGEFVVNASATRQNLGLLQAINSGRATQMLAAGGMVGMSRSVAGLDSGGGATINMKVINQAPGVEAVPGTDSAGNPTLIVRQVEGALAKRVGTRQSAIGRAANVPLRG